VPGRSRAPHASWTPALQRTAIALRCVRGTELVVPTKVGTQYAPMPATPSHALVITGSSVGAGHDRADKPCGPSAERQAAPRTLVSFDELRLRDCGEHDRSRLAGNKNPQPPDRCAAGQQTPHKALITRRGAAKLGLALLMQPQGPLPASRS